MVERMYIWVGQCLYETRDSSIYSETYYCMILCADCYIWYKLIDRPTWLYETRDVLCIQDLANDFIPQVLEEAVINATGAISVDLKTCQEIFQATTTAAPTTVSQTTNNSAATTITIGTTTTTNASTTTTIDTTTTTKASSTSTQNRRRLSTDSMVEVTIEAEFEKETNLTSIRADISKSTWMANIRPLRFSVNEAAVGINTTVASEQGGNSPIYGDDDVYAITRFAAVHSSQKYSFACDECDNAKIKTDGPSYISSSPTGGNFDLIDSCYHCNT